MLISVDHQGAVYECIRSTTYIFKWVECIQFTTHIANYLGWMILTFELTRYNLLNPNIALNRNRSEKFGGFPLNWFESVFIECGSFYNINLIHTAPRRVIIWDTLFSASTWYTEIYWLSICEHYVLFKKD